MGDGYKNSTPQKYKTMLLLKFGNLNTDNIWQPKIYKNIITIYVVYIKDILKILNGCTNGRRRHLEVYLSSKKPRISVKTV